MKNSQAKKKQNGLILSPIAYGQTRLGRYCRRSPRCDMVARLLKERHPMNLNRGLQIIQYGVRFTTTPTLPAAESNIWVGRDKRFVICFALDTLEQGKKYGAFVVWHELVHAHIMLLHGRHFYCSPRVESLIDEEARRVCKKSPLNFDQLVEIMSGRDALTYYLQRVG